MQLSKFTRDFLLLFSAPLVWAVHFLFVYTLTGIVCARGYRAEWLGVDALKLAIIGASLLAVAVIALTILRMPKSIDPFLRWSAAGLALLAVVAVAWEAAPVFLVPLCA